MILKKITEPQKLLLAGMNFYGNPFGEASAWTAENEVGVLWKRFIGFTRTNPHILEANKWPDAFLEIWLETAASESQGYFDVLVGIAVTTLETLPPECVARVLPLTRYAVYTLQGREITADWNQLIYRRHLPAAGLQPAHRYSIQYYGPQFKGLDRIDESTLEDRKSVV